MVISDCHVALSSGQLSVILLDFSHNYMHNYFSHSSLFLEMFSLLAPKALSTEKAMAPDTSTLAWKIPWTEEPGRLQSMGSLRVGHD